MARKLRETEDLLQAVETEKQSAESQVIHVIHIMLVMKDSKLETCSKFYYMFSFVFLLCAKISCE